MPSCPTLWQNGGPYAISDSGKRLVHGDVCTGVDKLIPDTDGKGTCHRCPHRGGGGGGHGFLWFILAVVVAGGGGFAWWRFLASDSQRMTVQVGRCWWWCGGGVLCCARVVLRCCCLGAAVELGSKASLSTSARTAQLRSCPTPCLMCILTNASSPPHTPPPPAAGPVGVAGVLPALPVGLGARQGGRAALPGPGGHRGAKLLPATGGRWGHAGRRGQQVHPVSCGQSGGESRAGMRWSGAVRSSAQVCVKRKRVGGGLACWRCCRGRRWLGQDCGWWWV